MSQPPPPPSQPPSGPPGQGATPPPPPGQSGYGYPQTPPPPPGPPQQLSQQSEQPSPEQVSAAPTQIAQAPTQISAAPTQIAQAPTQIAMPGPGAPGAPGAPPGPPGAPPYGGQVPPAPPSGGKGKVIGIVAAAVAAVLAIGGGTWFFLQDDGKSSDKDSSAASTDDSGKDAEKKDQLPSEPIDGRLAWQAEEPAFDKKEISVDASGTWFVGDNVIRALPTGVTAYNARSGEVAWSLDLPRPKGCATAVTPSGNKIALLHGTYCDQVAAVDLTSGKKLWSHELPDVEKNDHKLTTTLAVSGDLVALKYGLDKGAGWKLSSGEELWQGTAQGDCALKGYAGGKQIITVLRCYGDDRVDLLRGLGPDGTTEWEWEAPPKVEVLQVFSQSPLLLGVRAGSASEITDVMRVEQGKLVKRISIDQQRFDLDCTILALQPCPGVLVDDAHLYVPSKAREASDDYGRVNEIVAIDLETGKPKWQVLPDGTGELEPIALQDGRLLAYQRGGISEPGKVLSFDLSSRQPTTLMRLPDEGKRHELLLSSRSTPHWHNNAFYLVLERFSKIYSSAQPPVIAFTE